jgi:hypothetical protein
MGVADEGGRWVLFLINEQTLFQSNQVYPQQISTVHNLVQNSITKYNYVSMIDF